MSRSVRERLLDVAALVDRIRLGPERRAELLDLLDERASVYDGMTTGQVERLRGYVLASFEHTGLPDEAWPFVVEELTTGSGAYLLAAAGRALLGAAHLSDEVLVHLGGVIARIEGNDDHVWFDGIGEPVGTGGSAFVDILRTTGRLGSRAAPLGGRLDALTKRSDHWPEDARIALADARRSVTTGPAPPRPCCCGGQAATNLAKVPPSPAVEEIGSLGLQDQSGASFAYADFFDGRPSVVAFFYTRCMNPEKCSLTITKLARLQRLIRGEGLGHAVNVAAITYDPEFDLPDRLHAYGRERGMAFDARNRLLRTSGKLEPLQRHFDLGVGFGPSTVNRHRIELLVLDRSGRVADSFVRIQWREEDVVRSVRSILAGALVDPAAVPSVGHLDARERNAAEGTLR